VPGRVSVWDNGCRPTLLYEACPHSVATSLALAFVYFQYDCRCNYVDLILEQLYFSFLALYCSSPFSIEFLAYSPCPCFYLFLPCLVFHLFFTRCSNHILFHIIFHSTLFIPGIYIYIYSLFEKLAFSRKDYAVPIKIK